MMLNNVMLEADLRRDPEMLETGVCVLYVMHQGDHVEHSNFEVHAYDSLGEACMKTLKRRMRIRIAGKLAECPCEDDEGARCGRVFIEAEHVEVMPKSVPVEELAHRRN